MKNITIIINDGSSLLYAGGMNGLPVNESVLIAKSVEFFNDPEPCFIHRTAVQARLYAEFEQWLVASLHGSVCKKSVKYTVAIEAIPENFKGYFF